MAEIDNGALTFRSVLDNKQMDKALEETLRRVRGLSEGTEQSGKQMDEALRRAGGDIRKALGLIGEACQANEQAIQELEAQYQRLGKEASLALAQGADEAQQRAVKMQASIKGEIKLRQELLADARKLSNQLEEEAQKRERLQQTMQANEQAHKSVRTRIRELEQQMQNLTDRGINQQSEAYKALANELGRLRDIQGDVQRQGQILADDQAGFKSVVQGLQGLAGGFSAATGAVSLFAGENENLQKIMLKVQSLMAITIGLQQVSEALNKDSYLSLVALRRAKDAFAGASLRLAGALGISNVAAQALMATLTLGLSVAITAVVAGITYLVGKAGEAKRKVEELNKAVAETASAPLASLQRLRAEWQALGEVLEAKRRFVEDNRKAMQDLGLAIKDASDAERLFTSPEQVQRFISAQIAKAKATALINTEEYKKKIEELAKIETQLEEQRKRKAQVRKTGSPRDSTLENAINNKIKELEAQRKTLEAELGKTHNLAIKLEAEAQGKMQEINAQALERERGTVAEKRRLIESEIQSLRRRRDETQVADEAERKALDKEIQERQKELDTLEGKVQALAGGNLPNDGKKKQEALRAYKEQLAEELREAGGLLSQLELIEKKRQALTEKAGSGYDEQASVLKEIEAELLERSRQQGEKLLEQYAGDLGRKIALERQYSDDLALLERRRAEATTAGERAVIDEAIAIRKARYEEATRNPEELAYNELLRQYQTLEERKTALSKEYEQKRALAIKQGNERLAEQIGKDYETALSKLNFEGLKERGDFADLFSNIGEQGTRELEALIDRIEGELPQLSLELNPSDYKAVVDKVEALKRTVRERNPFKAIAQGYKDFVRASSSSERSGALVRMFDGAGSSAKALGGVLGEVSGALSSLGVDGADDIGLAVEAMGNLAESAAGVATSIATGNPIGAISGIVSGIGGAVKAIASFHDRQAERQIKHHQAQIVRLQASYKELEAQANKALGKDVYQKRQEQMKNLMQQQARLSQMIDEERGKKKSDGGKIEAWKGQIQELNRQIQELAESMKRDILQTDAKSLAGELGDALVEAFERGESAAKNFDKVVDNMLRRIILKRIQTDFIEEKLGGLLDKFYAQTSKRGQIEDMAIVEVARMKLNELLSGKYDIRGEGFKALINAYKKAIEGDRKEMEWVKARKGTDVRRVQDTLEKNFDKLVGEENSLYNKKSRKVVQDFREGISEIQREVSERLEVINEALGKDYLGGSAGQASQLTGAVKGVSEETASLISGYLNNIRMQQVQQADALERQLSALTQIAHNTRYNEYLELIYERLKSGEGDPLRARGL